MFRKLFMSLVLSLWVGAAAASTVEVMEVYSAEQAFATVRDNLKQAIINRGLVVSNVSHMGEMLARTGEDLGDAKPVYGEAEIFEFCSAVLSRAMVEADPRNIVHCPLSVAIYTLPAEPGRVYAAFRRPTVLAPEHALEPLQAIEELLRGVAREALELDF